MCVGLLSCWKIQPLGNLNILAGRSICVCSISRCCTIHFFSNDVQMACITRWKTPPEHYASHTWLDGYCIFPIACTLVPFLLHTCRALLLPNSSRGFVSSDNSTFSQNLAGLFWWLRANFRQALTCLGFRYSVLLMAALLTSMPATYSSFESPCALWMAFAKLFVELTILIGCLIFVLF